jgi:dephospho-CoA kinase
MNEDQKLIGITGGIASGKSAVASIIESEGYPVIRSDNTAKILMAENQDLKANIINTFGETTYKDGSPNKEAIANLIFGNSKSAETNRNKLNSIVHPFVIQENLKSIEKLFNEGAKSIFVESALIFEAGLENGYDYIICVYADESQVIERLKKRNKLSEDEIRARLDSQLSPQYKKSNADFTIDNNKSIEELESTTKFILDLVLTLPGKDPQKYEENS